ncbi:MAG: EutN/CcmL family microcompartment protein [Pseudomonadota bacterium]
MKLAVVTGTVTATAKDAALVGGKLLLTNLIDSEDAVIESAVVAYDTVGAGVGDKVLLVQGSAARLAEGTSALPVDASVIAVVDDVALPPASKSRAKKIPKAASARTSRSKKT